MPYGISRTAPKDNVGSKLLLTRIDGAVLKNEMEILLEIAREAGRAILEVYDHDFKVDLKADQTPLTNADRASHEIIVRRLNQYFPDVPVLSEEGASIPYQTRSSWTRFWLVDPLDGTKEFVKKNGEFTVNIALIEEGAPVWGVVYVPVTETLYWGGRGFEARMQVGNDEPRTIRVRQPDLQTGLTVVMSRSHPAPELTEYLRSYQVAEAISVGSSLKLCIIAEGCADLYPRLGPTMEWDIAAGHAVVEAAGGTLTTLDGETLMYNKQNLLNPYFIVSGQKESLHGL